MSILIKGMGMPTKKTMLVIFPNGYVAVFDETESFIGESRCVPVPEHGRLIDAFDTVKTLCDKGLYMHAEIVSDMPTIIPASGEGE